ncbi:MAG: M18 family aminopeptidase [Gammaproteobacteria bacterium]
MNSRQEVQNLLDFIDASPSPWHVVRSIETKLAEHRFVRLKEAEKWTVQPGGRYYVTRDDSSIVVIVAGREPLSETGFKIIGAHTDSPGLRIKPNVAGSQDGLARLGVEIYGSPIVATFADRDLSLAGRIGYRNEHGDIAAALVRFDEVLLRLPNLAIHMNRGVNEDGLKFNKQTELPLILSVLTEKQLPQPYFLSLLEELSGIGAWQILSWDLNVYDTQKGAFWGSEQEFYADSQIDNLASCHAAVAALLDDALLEQAGGTLVCAFFDHEEIGSESSKGACGSFLTDMLKRFATALGNDSEEYARALAQSFLISADMAHAYHPNFPNAYDPDHRVMVNNGPVIKINSNQRYSSESVSAAQFAQWCEDAGVPYQIYSHRSDLPCGSTIGPIASAKLGIRAVDVGCPMWAMHSIRESAGVLDHDYMIRVLQRFFSD